MPETAPSTLTDIVADEQPSASAVESHMVNASSVSSVVPLPEHPHNSLVLYTIAQIVCLLGTALSVAGFATATWYLTDCLDGVDDTALNVVEWSQIKNPTEEDKKLKLDVTCEDQTPLTYDYCKMSERMREKLLREGSLDTAASLYPEVCCPSKWLVEPFVYILGITWILNIFAIGTGEFKKHTGPSILKPLSVIAALTGFVVLVSSICLISFFGVLHNSDMWCKGNQTLASEKLHRAFDTKRGFKPKTCMQGLVHVFQPWLIMCGGMICALSGAVYGGASYQMWKRSLQIIQERLDARIHPNHAHLMDLTLHEHAPYHYQQEVDKQHKTDNYEYEAP